MCRNLKIFRAHLGLGYCPRKVTSTCAFVENGEQFLSVCVWAFAFHPESDERTNADVQPEAPATQR